MSVTDTWRPKRPGPASDRDNVTRQTLRAGIRAPPPEKPYVSNVIGGTGNSAQRRHKSVHIGKLAYFIHFSINKTFGMVDPMSY